MSESPHLKANASVVRRKEILSAEVDNEVVLMSVEQGVYYGLNPVGALVWSLLSEPVRIHDMCQRIVEEFDVTLEQCQGEVLELLDDMQAQGLIQIVKPGTSPDS